MRDLFIMRHGLSDGNKKRIIQGRLGGFTLTQEGECEIEKVLEEYSYFCQEIQFIFSSTEERCYKSAKIIERSLDVPIYTFDIYIEMNPGILGGENHDEAKARFPEYYDIWTKRGDLDGIPGAESGDCLQARAVVGIVLLSLYEKQYEAGIIVTHAGFMRSFVNTFYGRNRTTPIDVSNANIYRLQMSPEYFNKRRLYHSDLCDVYRIKAFEHTYAVKVRKGKLSCIQKDMIQFLSDTNHIPKVYYLTNASGHYFVVMEFYEGEKIHGTISTESVKVAFEKVKQAQLEINDKFGTKKNEFTTLNSKISGVIGAIHSKKVKDIVLAILSNYISLDCQNEYSICLYDLHRDNYLQDEKESIWVDMENAVLAPNRYGRDAFVASFVVLEGMDWRNYYEDSEDTELYYFLCGIFLRLIYGMTFFLNGLVSNSNILFKYVAAIGKILYDMADNSVLSYNDAKEIQEYIYSTIKEIHVNGKD